MKAFMKLVILAGYYDKLDEQALIWCETQQIKKSETAETSKIRKYNYALSL